MLLCVASATHADNISEIKSAELTEPVVTKTLAQHAFAHLTGKQNIDDAKLAYPIDQPRHVFLSVLRSDGRMTVFQGHSTDLALALKQACVAAKTHVDAGKPCIGVKVDVVLRMTIARHDQTMREPMLGLRGYIDAAQLRLPEQFLCTDIPFASPSNPVIGEILPSWFTTSSAWCDGGEPILLFRGHRIYQQLAIDDLSTAAHMAAAHLIGLINNDGRFIYEYDARKQEEADAYNVLRHCGTTFAIAQWAQASGDATALHAAVRAMNHAKQFIQPYPLDNAKGDCVVSEGFIKLGGSALALLAMCQIMETSGDQSLLPDAQRLAEFIVSLQEDSGRYFADKIDPRDGTITKSKVSYYPGEATFALSRLYRIDKDERWINAAFANALYHAEVLTRDQPTNRMEHDHWLLYALNEIQKHKPDERLVAHTRRLVQAITDHTLMTPAFSDWVGGHYRPPRSAPAATRLEGLVSAYQLLAREEGVSRGELDALQSNVDITMRFMLQLQLQPELAMYLQGNPGPYIGGFRAKLTDFVFRIDFAQHALSAILGYIDVLKSRQESAKQTQ